jgi:hypothetical protein
VPAEAKDTLHIQTKLDEGHTLYNVRVATPELIRRTETKSSEHDKRIEANVLKHISKRIKIGDLKFNVMDDLDDNYVNVTRKHLQNDPIHKKFKYNSRNKSDVQTAILKYLSGLNTQYKLPASFMIWDCVPLEIAKQNVEQRFGITQCI